MFVPKFVTTTSKALPGHDLFPPSEEPEQSVIAGINKAEWLTGFTIYTAWLFPNLEQSLWNCLEENWPPPWEFSLWTRQLQWNREAKKKKGHQDDRKQKYLMKTNVFCCLLYSRAILVPACTPVFSHGITGPLESLWCTTYICYS